MTDIYYLGKLLLSLMFIVSVYKNITGGFKTSVSYVKSINFPLPAISVILGLIIKIFGIYSLLTGNYINIALPLLIGFTILVTILFNNPLKHKDKFWMFFSLMGVIGGLGVVYDMER